MVYENKKTKVSFGFSIRLKRLLVDKVMGTS
jgi:hypothetical protein